MISADQMHAARSLPGMDRRRLVEDGRRGVLLHQKSRSDRGSL